MSARIALVAATILRDGEVEIDVGLKIDLLDRQPIHALRFDILDTVDVRAIEYWLYVVTRCSISAC
jgi:hypothetical protein